MSKDDEFEQMLDGLEIVAESLEEESHTVLPRVDQLKRRRTLLDPVSYTHLTLRRRG